MGEALSDIGGDGGAGTMKSKLTSQFIGQQREIEWLGPCGRKPAKKS